MVLAIEKEAECGLPGCLKEQTGKAQALTLKAVDGISLGGRGRGQGLGNGGAPGLLALNC